MHPTTPDYPLDLDSKPDSARCLARIEAWFNQAVLDRPPIRFYHHNVEYEGGAALDPARWATLRDRWFDVEYQVEAFERSIAGRTFHAETFPVFWPNLGPNVYSAFYGGELEFAEVTSWYAPLITDLEDLSVLAPDPLTSVYFRKLDELTRAALERCAGKYLVGYSDLHPSLDCVAAWRGIPALCMDLATAPDKLEPLLERSVRDFHRIFDHFDRLLKARGLPSVTWLGIPSLGKLHIPNCDVAAMISTRHFARCSLPLLRREVAGMTRNIYHVDGKGVAQHLDLLLAMPDIHAIQWVQGLGLDQPILQWVPLLRRIQAAGKSIVVDLQLNELEGFIAAVEPEGVFLCLGVEEGQEPEVIKRLEQW
jgi:hypothetical protein